MKQSTQYSAKKSFAIIALSLLSVLLLFLFSLPFTLTRGETKIRKMVVKGKTNLRIPLPLFAELLSLSYDKAPEYHEFSIQKAQNHLISLGVFKTISLKKRKPDLLLIEYELKEPAFVWGKEANCLVNRQGEVMPYAPYYTPKRLPVLYLEKEHFSQFFPLALFLQQEMRRGELLLIDMRGMGAASKAKREIVIKICYEGCDHLIRLDPVDIEDQIARYDRLLDAAIHDKPLQIDLRFPNTAYLLF